MGGSASKVSDQMGDLAGKWNSRDVKGSQSELFRRIVPSDECDFTEQFTESQLDYVFTNEGGKLQLSMAGPVYNSLYLHRDAIRSKTVFPVYEEEHPKFGLVRVMHPLGAPGLDLGNGHTGKGSHLMAIKVLREGEVVPVTFNDMLPTTYDEMLDFEWRLKVLSNAQEAMKKNVALSECGKFVRDKASSMGVDPAVGIRQFLITMIEAYPDKDGRPGYTLTNAGNMNIADKTLEVARTINNVYEKSDLKKFFLVQPPGHNSQLISHIHSFWLEEVPECMSATYVDCEEILRIKKENTVEPQPEPQPQPEPEPDPELDVSEEEDDGCELTRTNTVMT